MRNIPLKEFIKYGYFPKELPPSFSTENFSEKISQLSNFFEPICATKPVLFNIPKSGFRRRTLHLPNPLGYISAVQLITNLNSLPWQNTEIESYACPFHEIENRKLSEDDSPYDPELIQNIKMEDVSFFKARGLCFRLSTDIAQFFSSIYTHSISWAVRGKTTAKESRNDDHWSNKLDKFIRNMQDCETVGIQVGPILSLVVSEIILKKVDKNLTDIFNKKFGNDMWNGSRYVDDFWFYFASRKDAESALSDIAIALSEFNLEINAQKTHIKEAPFEFEPKWKTELSTIIEKIKDSATVSNSDLSYFINSTLFWAKKLQGSAENPLKYAFKAIRELKGENIWDKTKSFVLQSIHIEPNCLDIVSSFLKNNSEHISEEDKNHILKILSKYLRDESKMQHDYEVCWIIQILLDLNLRIDSDTAQKVLDAKRPMMVLSLLILKKHNLIDGEFEISQEIQNILSSKEESPFKNEWWLCAYEIYRNDSLDVISAIFLPEPPQLFQKLKEKNISFLAI
ncbi:MAG: RNA-directed DNA polymerase [Candidatus Gracilibacteria bacterium]|nr:RNA-directed DNA polymerase [Candidatus Gracilibacteria bacterium]